MSYLDDIRKARIEVWEQMPLEVGKLGQNQQTMQPAGRASGGPAETGNGDRAPLDGHRAAGPIHACRRLRSPS